MALIVRTGADGVGDQAVGVVAGSISPCTADGVCTRSLIPVGSSTKPWTAVAVLQYVDQGMITLDTLAYTLLDKVVQPQCGSTMVSLP